MKWKKPKKVGFGMCFKVGFIHFLLCWFLKLPYFYYLEVVNEQLVVNFNWRRYKAAGREDNSGYSCNYYKDFAIPRARVSRDDRETTNTRAGWPNTCTFVLMEWPYRRSELKYLKKVMGTERYPSDLNVKNDTVYQEADYKKCRGLCESILSFYIGENGKSGELKDRI